MPDDKKFIKGPPVTDVKVQRIYVPDEEEPPGDPFVSVTLSFADEPEISIEADRHDRSGRVLQLHQAGKRLLFNTYQSELALCRLFGDLGISVCRMRVGDLMSKSREREAKLMLGFQGEEGIVRGSYWSNTARFSIAASLTWDQMMKVCVSVAEGLGWCIEDEEEERSL